MASVTVVDYGMGNLRSVGKALERAGAEVRVSHDPADVRGCDGLVLPGVGAFAAAMENLRASGWVDSILEHIRADRPFLGICLGLQLLFERSEEWGGADGLAVLPGTVTAFPPAHRDVAHHDVLKVPHMGWNQLRFRGTSPLFAGIPEGSWVYFVHSFYAPVTEGDATSATSVHGVEFAAAVSRGAMMACQFHPEKSQAVGIHMLENFVRTCR